MYTFLIFLCIILISVYLLISFLHFFSPPHPGKICPSIIHPFSILFTWLNSLLHQRAPTPRWPSVWRPMIECTTWWLRHLRPCVYGWTSWLQELKDTCISWCSQSQKFIGLDFFGGHCATWDGVRRSARIDLTTQQYYNVTMYTRSKQLIYKFHN